MQLVAAALEKPTVRSTNCRSVRPPTQQDGGTQQDGDQRSGAQARRAAQSLNVAQLHVALAVAGTHSDRQGARAALHGVVAVRDDHRDQVDALVEAAVAGAASQDACGVVCREEEELGENRTLLGTAVTL